MSSKVNSRLLSKSRFCPTQVKYRNPQCEVFFLKCQQDVFWHRGWVVESWGFARGFCRGKRSREWHVGAVGSQGREGRDNSVTEEWWCRSLPAGRCGEEEEESSLSQSSSSSSRALSSTICCLSRIFPPDCIILHLLLLGKDQAATPGNRFCVLAAIEVLGEGQQCQVEGRGGRLLHKKIFLQLSLTAVCFAYWLALWNKTLLYCILSRIHCTKPEKICYL